MLFELDNKSKKCHAFTDKNILFMRLFAKQYRIGRVKYITLRVLGVTNLVIDKTIIILYNKTNVIKRLF